MRQSGYNKDMQKLEVTTNQKRQIIDITDLVTYHLPESEGVLTVFVPHTTAAITTADLDPGTDLDFLDFLKSLEPNIRWRHPHNPAHAPDHFISSIIGPSVSIPYYRGELQIGQWQRIVLVECDGPRERTLIIS